MQFDRNLYRNTEKLRNWFYDNIDSLRFNYLKHEKDDLMVNSVSKVGISVTSKLLDYFERVTMLVPDRDNYDKDDDIHFVCFNCGCEIQNENWSNNEECTIEWNYCPKCGYKFVDEETVSAFHGTTLKCENCGHCRSEGYEYPETYCELGITDDHEASTCDGCSLTKAQRIKLCKEIKEPSNPDWFSLWWDETED